MFFSYLQQILFQARSIQEQKICTTSSSGLPKWRQSPIDISRFAVWSKKFPPLLLTNYWSNDGTAILTNTGKTGSPHSLV